MKLQHTPTLTTDLNSAHLLLDSTSLINASKSDEFLSLLTKIGTEGCTLLTIPSVVYEFTRGAPSVEEFDRRLAFIDALGVTVLNRIEELVKQEPIFLVAYIKAFSSRGEKGPSYTDSLLCAVAYKHRTSNLLIMTANHKDIPSNIFDRKELITIDVNGELRTEAIYEFSSTKFTRVLTQLERNQP